MNAQQFQEFLAANNDAIAAIHVGPASDVKLRPFAVTDAVGWLAWRQHAESVAQLKNWGNTPASRTRARWAIRAAMQDAAARAVSDIDAGVAPQAGDTVENFLDLYQHRFCPESLSRLARSNFQGACQHEGETVLEWHTRCRSLYLRAHPAQAGNVERNRDMIDKFVEGLAVSQVRIHTYDAYPQSYAIALTHASNKVASVQVEERVAGRRSSSSFQIKSEGDLLAIRPTYGGAGGQAQRKCFFCGNSNHLKADCEMWKRAKDQLLGPGGGGGQGFRSTGAGRGARRGRGGPRGGRSFHPRGNRSLHQLGELEGAEESENC